MSRLPVLLLAGGLALWGSRAPAEPAEPALVPASHWAYGALAELERAGVYTGYPHGLFSGARRLTRTELAQATAAVASDLQPVTIPEWARHQGEVREWELRREVWEKLGRTAPATPEPVQRLIAEFRPELERLKINLARLTWTAATPPEPVAPEEPLGRRSEEYRRGVREAIAEWKRGDVTDYVPGGEIDPIGVNELGLPLQAICGCVMSRAAHERMLGHNEEVYRLILRHGQPANARRQWLGEMNNPEWYWRVAQHPTVRVRVDGPELVSPDEALRVRLEPQRRNERPQLVITSRAGTVTRPVWAGPSLGRELKWGPAGSDLLFLFAGSPSDGQYEVLDGRTGRLLTSTYVWAETDTRAAPR